jgi:hypothetical protein
MLTLQSKALEPLETLIVFNGLPNPNSGEKAEPFTVTTLPDASTPNVAPAEVGVAEVRFVSLIPEVFSVLDFTSKLVAGDDVAKSPIPTLPFL